MKKNKTFFDKFERIQDRYKKNPKIFIAFTSCIIFLFCFVFGSSYAYLMHIAKTNHTTLIEAGTLALELDNESNSIFLEEAVPKEDNEAIEKNKEYSFTIKNTGSIPSVYKIKLENTCTIGNNYTHNEETEIIDKCIPNEYIKAGIKTENGNYEVVKVNEEGEILLTTGSLNQNESKEYKLKIWLDWNTPNEYSGKNQTVIYKGKLNIDYEQGL